MSNANEEKKMAKLTFSKKENSGFAKAEKLRAENADFKNIVTDVVLVAPPRIMYDASRRKRLGLKFYYGDLTEVGRAMAHKKEKTNGLWPKDKYAVSELPNGDKLWPVRVSFGDLTDEAVERKMNEIHEQVRVMVAKQSMMEYEDVDDSMITSHVEYENRVRQIRSEAQILNIEFLDEFGYELSLNKLLNLDSLPGFHGFSANPFGEAITRRDNEALELRPAAVKYNRSF